MALLSAVAVEQALSSIGGWRLDGAVLARQYSFKDFREAMVFVNRVAAEAEAAGHHPDIDIRYAKVRLMLTSHDAGGITQRDINLAKNLNGIPLS